MTPDKPIPFYAPDGRPLGVRTPDAAPRLMRAGYATPSYGRKGHIKAIWLKREDGSSPVISNALLGTSYSYREHLDSGLHLWALRRLGKGNELWAIFTQVVADCLVGAE